MIKGIGAASRSLLDLRIGPRSRGGDERESLALRRLLGAVALWGLGFPLGKALSLAVASQTCRPFGLVDSAVTSSIRYLMAGVLLFALVPAARTRPSRKELAQGGGMGLVLALAVTAMQWGVALGRASTAAFLTQMYLVFVVAFVLARRRKAPSRTLVVAVGASLAGCAALAGVGFDGIRLEPGVWPLLFGALLGAVQILLLDVPRFQGNRSEPVTMAMFVSMGGVLLAFLPMPGALQCLRASLLAPASLGLLLVLAGAVTTIPFLAMTRYQPMTTPVRASMLYTLEPVVSSIAALFVPGLLSGLLGIAYPDERLTGRLMVGAVLILAGNLVLARGDGSTGNG